MKTLEPKKKREQTTAKDAVDFDSQDLATLLSHAKIREDQLREQLKAANARIDGFVAQFDKLREYCQQLIQQTLDKREALAKNLERAQTQSEILTTHLKEREQSLMIEVQRQEIEFEQKILEYEKELTQARNSENQARFQVTRIDADLKRLREINLGLQIQISQAREALTQSLSLMTELSRSAGKLTSPQNGSAQETLLFNSQALSAVVEQWQNELNRLRLLEAALRQPESRM